MISMASPHGHRCGGAADPLPRCRDADGWLSSWVPSGHRMDCSLNVAEGYVVAFKYWTSHAGSTSITLHPHGDDHVQRNHPSTGHEERCHAWCGTTTAPAQYCHPRCPARCCVWRSQARLLHRALEARQPYRLAIRAGVTRIGEVNSVPTSARRIPVHQLQQGAGSGLGGPCETCLSWLMRFPTVDSC